MEIKLATFSGEQRSNITFADEQFEVSISIYGNGRNLKDDPTEKT